MSSSIRASNSVSSAGGGSRDGSYSGNASTGGGSRQGNSNNSMNMRKAISSRTQQQQQNQHSPSVTTERSHNHVSECIYEFLLSEILHLVESECESTIQSSNNINNNNNNGDNNDMDNSNGKNKLSNLTKEEQAILGAERAAAKIERLGFGVGYRLCERLAQAKPLAVTNNNMNSSTATSQQHNQNGSLLSTNPNLDLNNNGDNNNGDAADTTPSSTTAGGSSANNTSYHLEAVKFLCKEFWTEVFRKQIDKLQTNHRGIFVLKDNELRWLRRFPTEDERSRVAAIKMLAFPCGLIRGALSNLGISAVVSCDFLADGRSMSACSFNIKIKA